MGLTKRKRKRVQWWPLKDVQVGKLPASYRKEEPPKAKPAHGPRDLSVPDCPPDYFARPEQVAADQRAAVAEAMRACGPLTPEELSGLVDLAPDVVKRRLAEIAQGVNP